MKLQILEKAEKQIVDSSLWEKFTDFLDIIVYENDTQTVIIKLGSILLFFIILLITSIVLRFIRKLITKKLPIEDKTKFISVFSYAKWLIYLIVLLIFISGFGIKLTGLLAASAGLLLGIGLALQVFFQDIISGIFILVDQSVHVGDIIEIDGKVGRVEEIKLRTTRAVTIDDKVLIIPNHLYLTNSLYNWTQNGTSTRETVDVGVAYGSNVELVKQILLLATESIQGIYKNPAPTVIFTDFGESSLNFRVAFTIDDSFNARIPKSDLRFEIDRLFRENNITIPFPQRDIHIIKK